MYSILSDLTQGEKKLLKGYYFCEEKNKNGKQYLTAVFTDISGEKAYYNIFSNNLLYTVFKNAPNCFSQCEIEFLGENNGYKQFIFHNIIPLMDPNKGILSDIQKLEAELWGFINSIKNNNLREVTSMAVKDNWDLYSKSPASKLTGYSYEGGLLTQTVRVCRLLKEVCAVYHNWDLTKDKIFIPISYDALITAAIISDIGLISYYELEKNEVNVTLYGRLMEKHIAGLLYAVPYISKLPNKEYILLTHIILNSHSKSYKVSTPRTIEAEILASVKELDKAYSNFEYLFRLPSNEVTIKLNNKEYCLESFD